MSEAFKKKPTPKTSSPVHAIVLRVLTPEVTFTAELWKCEPSSFKEFAPVNLQEVVSSPKKHDKNIMRVHYSMPYPDEKKLMRKEIATRKKAKDVVLKANLAFIYRNGVKICVPSVLHNLYKLKLSSREGC